MKLLTDRKRTITSRKPADKIDRSKIRYRRVNDEMKRYQLFLKFFSHFVSHEERYWLDSADYDVVKDTDLALIWFYWEYREKGYHKSTTPTRSKLDARLWYPRKTSLYCILKS